MARHQKRGTGQFVALPHAVLKTRKYAALDGWAVKLLVDLCLQYTGRNNGDLSLPWSILRERGWRSKGTVARAERALRDAGFIIRTRKGGCHKCSLYAVAWHRVDDCINKRSGLPKNDHPWNRSTLTPPGGWRDDEPPIDPRTPIQESDIEKVTPMRTDAPRIRDN